jgi:tetratricopeptide (TPR) repeat protein
MTEESGSTTPQAGLVTLDELAEEIARTRRVEAAALAARGRYHSMLGSPDEARRLIGLAVEMAEGMAAPTRVAVYEMLLGDAETEAGDAVAAARGYRRSYEVLDAIGAEGYKSTSAALLARALCDLDLFDEAEGYAAIARSVSADDDRGPQALGRSAQARVLASRGEFADAERLGREAVQIFSDAEDPNTQARIWTDLARCLRMAGNIGEARRAAAEALERYERKGNRASSASTRAFLEELD